jgi:RPA family protein
LARRPCTHPKKGTVLTSIRAEKVVLADENIRNTWLVETAKATLDRLAALKTNISPPVVASSPHSEAKPATKATSDGPMSLEDMKNFVEQKIIATNKGKGVKLETLSHAKVQG